MRFGALEPAQVLSTLVVPLATAASLAGLFVPGLYRETAWVVPQNRGQDLVTLAALCVLVVALILARRGSARALLIWIGVLGYVWYTYVGAAFVYRFNELFLVYVALFSLSSAALIALLAPLHVAALHATFDKNAPRRATALFLLAMAAILSAMWLSQIVAFLVSGALPDLIVKANAPTNYVFVLDLGVVVPVSVLGAVLLWRDAAWGYVLAAAMAVKAATMGLALLSMTAFAAAAGQPVEAGLVAVWVAIAVGGLGFSAWLILSSRSRALAAREGASGGGK
jgi:hypothetical protein